MNLHINEPWITSKVRCQNGYVYIDKGFWNPKKQQADHKREYIGKFDGHTFTPNKSFHRLKAEYQQSLTVSKTGPVPTDICLRQFYGATHLLDQICDNTGIAADLDKCFGSLSEQILSVAYYLVLEKDSLCIVSPNGVLLIYICMAKIFHHREAVSSLVLLLKKQR